MEELFAPPVDAWERVSPRLAVLRRWLLVAGVVAALVAVGAGRWLLPGVGPVWWLAAAVAVLLAGAVAWRAVGRNVASWGYAEREEDLVVRHGVLFRRLVVVPYGRMQFVDVHAGPLALALGVASVHLHTASPGTSAEIPGLPAREATRLRDRLTSLGESQAAGL